MNSGWSIRSFLDVFADVSSGNVKTLQSEYLSQGSYPVVDQGKTLVGGYVNDPSRLCNVSLPAIVFGDHTRIFKYIDFPFCMGADGLKVLRPRVDADVRYLYYYLSSLPLTDGGYDRHFKYLKRADITIPPLPEQRRIAAILDQADALRAKRRAALTELETLTQSIFVDMFGDPATNPNTWDELTISDLCKVKGGKRLPKGEEYSPEPTPFRYIRVTDLQAGWVDESELLYLRPEVQARISRYTVTAGDVIISIAGSIGLIALVTASISGANLTENAAKLVPIRDDAYDVVFLSTLLRTPFVQRQIRSHVGQVTIGKLALFRIEKLCVYLPPIDLQRRFAQRTQTIQSVLSVQGSARAHLDALFASLQHRAFRGEL